MFKKAKNKTNPFPFKAHNNRYFSKELKSLRSKQSHFDFSAFVSYFADVLDKD